jgi:hypothetical protein
MNPQKQKQMVSQLFENSAKSTEELDKMTPDEKKEYLRGRLKQRMFFNGVSRQSTQQKKKMQEKIEESTKQPGEEADTGMPLSKTAQKNKKKKEKKRVAKAAEKAVMEVEENEDNNDDVVIVKRESESDYESDDN